MTSLSGSIFKSFLFAVFFLGCMALMPSGPIAFAQETPQYTAEEYAAYLAVAAEADPAKKMELILNFFKTYPKSTLAQHVTADFQTMLKNLQDAKKWAQSIYSITPSFIGSLQYPRLGKPYCNTSQKSATDYLARQVLQQIDKCPLPVAHFGLNGSARPAAANASRRSVQDSQAPQGRSAL